jgi:hypothetical protein
LCTRRNEYFIHSEHSAAKAKRTAKLPALSNDKSEKCGSLNKPDIAEEISLCVA